MNWLLLKPCGQSLVLINPCSGACGIGGHNGVVRAYAHAPCNPPTATHPQISCVPLRHSAQDLCSDPTYPATLESRMR